MKKKVIKGQRYSAIYSFFQLLIYSGSPISNNNHHQLYCYYYITEPKQLKLDGEKEGKRGRNHIEKFNILGILGVHTSSGCQA